MSTATKKTEAQKEYDTAYYPSGTKLEILPHKIYLLTWQQHGATRSKLLNKSKAFALVNDPNVDRRLRDEVLKAFRAGAIQ